MNKLKFIFSVFLFSVGLFCPAFSFAQNDKTQPDASYEIVLQMLTGSNSQGEKANLPPSLSNAVKRLKTDYAFSNYRLTSTYLQRISSMGSVEFKVMSYDAVPNPQGFAPTILEWHIGQMTIVPNDKGQNSIQLRNFRFTQRVPLMVGNSKTESGNSTPAIVYEQFGLTMQRIGLPENVPTVIGTLSTAKSDELMFLILTVKPTE